MFRKLLNSGAFGAACFDISNLKENRMDPAHIRGDYVDNNPQFTSLLNETYSRIGRKYFDSVVAEVKTEILKRLQKDFPRFYAFLDAKSAVDDLSYDYVWYEYNNNLVLGETFDLLGLGDMFGDPKEGYDKVKGNSADDTYGKIFRFGFRKQLGKLSDFEFHDAVGLLEADCRDNLNGRPMAELFEMSEVSDPKCIPDHATKTYSYEYGITLKLSTIGLIYNYIKQYAEDENVGVEFSYGKLPEIKDCGFSFALVRKSDGVKIADSVYKDGKYVFGMVPDKNADKYEVRLVSANLKADSASKSVSNVGSANSSSSSSNSLKSLFGSIMCEVCGEHLALYEAFDPVKNKRVNFCRSCLEKRQQEDNAKLQKALEQLQIL